MRRKKRLFKLLITTWKYQLSNELRSGDKVATEYYKRVYKDKNRDLYGDNFKIIEVSK